MGKAMARRLGYRFVDTGLMYRAVALLALQRGIDPEDDTALGELARRTSFTLRGTGEDTVILVNGQDVSDRLRDPEVEGIVSLVARQPSVRQALVEHQRRMAGEGRVVMVGRDIGTVVLPHADLKLFLTASPAERARRRHRELVEQGREADLEQVLRDLLIRDRIDSSREHAPLRPAEDAVVLETDHVDVEGVVERILSLTEDP